jgi:xanthine dehydrogenase accessory factor
MGFTDEVIGRLHGPIGLDINASTPEEIALSVMAEIVKAQRG